jgi:hypothetical protein
LKIVLKIKKENQRKIKINLKSYRKFNEATLVSVSLT